MLNATSMTWFVWKWNFTLVHFFLNRSFKLIDVEKLHFVFYIFLVIVLEKIKVQVWIWILRQRSKFREKSRGKFNLHFPSKQVINNQHMKMRRWNMLMVFFLTSLFSVLKLIRWPRGGHDFSPWFAFAVPDVMWRGSGRESGNNTAAESQHEGKVRTLISPIR